MDLLTSMEGRGLGPDVVSYGSAISACEKGARWAAALELLGVMERRGVAPNEICFNAALSALAVGTQWTRALALLRDVRARGLASTTTVNAALTALVSCEVIEKVDIRGAGNVTVNAVAELLAKRPGCNVHVNQQVNGMW